MTRVDGKSVEDVTLDTYCDILETNDAAMSTAHGVLNELLDPVAACLTAEVAERLVQLRAPESVQARMEELAKKSEQGSLSDREREEYEAFVSAGNFVAILQSKARRLLKDRPA